MRKRKILIVSAMILAFAISVFSVSASAASIHIEKYELKIFQSISDKNVGAYPSVSVSHDGRYINEQAYIIHDTTYIPLRAVSTAFGAEVSFDSQTRSASVKMQGLDMTVSDGGYIVFANGRPVLSKNPAVILSDGRMYVPVRSIAKVFSLDVEWTPERVVKLSGEVTIPTHANHYYRYDEIYWLSRIINAESRGESLLGKIAVGNVVLNRTRHKDYPNTIYGVIFDRKYGVQFSPVLNGSIYAAPTYESELAAKICLEGFSVSDKILFFLAPDKSTSAWIPANRPYAFTVENHWFFN